MEQSKEPQLREIMADAERGKAEAQYILGTRYLLGNGVEKDYRMAAKWYGLAAAQGHGEAQNRLGSVQHTLGGCYKDGQGVTQSLFDALLFYLRASANGYEAATEQMNALLKPELDVVSRADSMCKIGQLYHHGEGMPVNKREAFAWYRKALSHGAYWAKSMIADLGLDWHDHEARRGEAASQYYLGEYIHKLAISEPFEMEYSKALVGELNDSLDWYKMAAAQGYADAAERVSALSRLVTDLESSRLEEVHATYRLARRFETGDEVEVDDQEALRLYELAAEKGHGAAAYAIGNFYYFSDYYGSEVIQDFEMALVWYRKGALLGHRRARIMASRVEKYLSLQKAAEDGDKIAQFKLGQFLEREWLRENEWGMRLDEDPDFLVEWYTKSAEQHYAPAMFALAETLINTYAPDADLVEEVMGWYSKAVAQGYTPAMFRIGELHEEGKHVPLNVEHALEWYRYAAEHGSAAAEYRIAEFYRQGIVVNEDFQQALLWYRRAAEHGDGLAMLALGDFHEAGYKMPKFMEDAAKWYLKAAECKVAEAQYRLGLCYENGIGIRKDPGQAAHWYKKAAKQEHPLAQLKAGEFLEAGEHMPRNMSKAVALYRAAAFKGYAEAQLSYGRCLMRGEWIGEDPVEAYTMFNLAAITIDEAARLRDELAPKLTAQEINNAQKRSNDLFQKLQQERKRPVSPEK